MKKRNAILCSLIFPLIIAYLAWCWRPFYLRQGFAYENNVPPDAEKVVEEWQKRQVYWEPLPFHSNVALSSLMQPMKSQTKVRVFYDSDWDAVFVDEQIYPLARVSFEKVNDRWQLSDYVRLDPSSPPHYSPH